MKIRIKNFFINYFSNRNSSEDLSNAINWSHIDGLFDVILTIGKQTMIEIDEKVGFQMSSSHILPVKIVSQVAPADPGHSTE